ncbi:hypothetical protein FLONG3_6255, partial [Fusarium longipes]
MAGDNDWPLSTPDLNDDLDQSWLDPALIDPNLFNLAPANTPPATGGAPSSPQPRNVQAQDPTLTPALDPEDDPFFLSTAAPSQSQPSPIQGYPVPTPAYPTGYPPVATTGYPVATPAFPTGYPPVYTTGYPVPTPAFPTGYPPISSPGFSLTASAVASPAATGSAFSNFSPSPYPDPPDGSTQTPFTTPGASDSGVTRGKKRGRASSPDADTDKPRRTRRKTTKSSAAAAVGGDDSQVDTDTPVSGRPRTRATTRSQGKASNLASTPAPVRPPNQRKNGLYIRPSRLKLPSGADAFALTVAKKAARVKDKDKDAEENIDMTQGKKTYMGVRGNNEILAKGGICDFCANHPIGKTMFAANPVCDWEQIPSGGPDIFNRECSNCANYRSQTRQPGDIATDNDHMCRVPGVKAPLIDFKHKRYGNADPANYAAPICGTCSRNNASGTCDVDATLGYFCTRCRRDQRCCIGDDVMPLKRPNKLARSAWYRHACDRCLARHLEFKNLKGNECCDWLTDRRLWGEQRQGCSRCLQDGAPCMDDKSNIIAPPSREPPPTTWKIRDKFEVDESRKKKDRRIKWYEYAESTTKTIWRKKCAGCQWAGASVECNIMWHQSDYACERCTQFGVDCTVYDFDTDTWTRYPIYDLSRVGFGHYTPYVVCQSCKDNGRNCDRMRPCDSCTDTGSQCDRLTKLNAHGCINRAKIAAHGKNEPAQPPGPLYYLALGYGPGGVNDIKDGRSVEHWIGPVAAVYGINTLKDGAQHYRAVADLHRDHRPPDNVLPPGTSTPLYTAEGTLGVFSDVQSRELTVEQLAVLIIHHWPNYQVPVGNSQAYRSIWHSLRDAQSASMAGAGVDTNLSVAPAIPRTFQGNPVLSDLEAFHNGLLGLPVGQSVAPPARAQAQSNDDSDIPNFDQEPDLGQEEENSYAALDAMIASGAYGDQQGSDGQRAQQAQPTAVPDITTMNQDDIREMFGLGGDTPRGRFIANQNYTKGFRADKRQKSFANRCPQNAETKEKTFNPFLGFVLDANQKPRLRPKKKDSRWKVFNPLEDLDMEKWHKSSSQPDGDDSEPRLFSVVNGRWKQPAPQANVLDDVPYEQEGGRSQQCCAEPGNGGIGRCGSQKVNGKDQAVCQSLAHRNTMPGYFPVCDDCIQGNVKDMFRHDHNPITESELLSMRAYLCNDCAGGMSSSVQNAAEYRAIGARRIYAGGDHSQKTYTPNNDPSRAVEFHS